MYTSEPVHHLGIPAHLLSFEASHAAAHARLQAVNPQSYANTRNQLDGAVTGLSPYFTHGLLSLTQAAGILHERQPLSFEDKLVFEFGWREFFHHVWQRAGDNGDAILRDLHGTAPWHGTYADQVPADIREGRTGVAAIDSAIRVLYETGYLHNHARMWLASYVVHLRKVHWRAGADWLYGHLLDGDLPSNHLSWQWVAGTFSSKPYLFNADNVLKYAPAAQRHAWASPGSVIDQSYEALDALARQRGDVGPERGHHAGVDEPVMPHRFHPSFMPLAPADRAPLAINNIAGCAVELIHPWSLSLRAAPVQAEPAKAPWRIGIIHLPAHAPLPWSERRWRFVLQAMTAVTDTVWIGDVGLLDLSTASHVSAQATLFPGYRDVLIAATRTGKLTPAPRLMPDPAMRCASFSKFYERVRREVGHFPRLLEQ